MRRLAALLLLVCASAAHAGSFTTPGSRTTQAGVWNVRQAAMRTSPNVFIADSPLTLDARQSSGAFCTSCYLLGIGLSYSSPTITGTPVDLLGGSGGQAANMSIEGHYANITLRAPANALGMIADTDVGWVFNNDGVNKSYQMSFGYYDHSTFSTLVSGTTINTYATVWANPKILATAGSFTASDIYGLYAIPNPSTGATINNWHGAYLTDVAIAGTLLNEIGVDITALNDGTTLVAGLRSNIAPAANHYAIQEIGGAKSQLLGPLIANPVSWAQANLGGI